MRFRDGHLSRSRRLVLALGQHCFTLATAVATWFYTIVGVDRKPQQQRRGEETLERFGDIVEDRAPVPRFLSLTYVGVAVWAIAYVLWVGHQRHRDLKHGE